MSDTRDVVARVGEAGAGDEADVTGSNDGDSHGRASNKASEVAHASEGSQSRSPRRPMLYAGLESSARSTSPDREVRVRPITDTGSTTETSSSLRPPRRAHERAAAAAAVSGQLTTTWWRVQRALELHAFARA